MGQDGEPEDMPWRQRICKKDSRKFMKYIKSTPTHGVVHIFVGKSIVRRVYWTFIILAAASYCLFNISERIKFLSTSPTSTTRSLVHHNSLQFPVVTVCNLNLVKLSYLQQLEAQGINISAFTEFDYKKCTNYSSGRRSANSSSLNLTRITQEGGQSAEELIQDCYFMGRQCSSKNFTTANSRLGVCHSFNSNLSSPLSNLSPGPRFGLELVLNITQEDYGFSMGGDAGVSVVVHSQGEPGEPTDAGVTVPPGLAARVALSERRVRDLSSTAKCRSSDSANFDFLPADYQYSLSACLSNAYFTAVAKNCGCFGGSTRPRSGPYSDLPDCGVSDLCCISGVFLTPSQSNCQSACTYTRYSTTVSYSAVPAEYVLDESGLFNRDREEIKQNTLSVNVFFQDFVVEEDVTRDAYSSSALLSDIGGQLGLFLGASVVSILEFFLWILDEVKDRCVGVNDKKLARWLRQSILQCRHWEREAQLQIMELETAVGNKNHTKSQENKFSTSVSRNRQHKPAVTRK